MISKRNYFAIVMLMLTVFIMFMFVGKSNDFIINNFIKQRSAESSDIRHSDFLTADKLNIENTGGNIPTGLLSGKKLTAIISRRKNGPLTGLIEEWCIYSKYPYKIFGYLPDADEIGDFNLIIFGDIKLSEADVKTLHAFADLGKTMIFTGLPDYQAIRSDRELANIFGIDEVIAKEVKADGIKIFSDFMISGERIYQKGDYFGSENDTSFMVPHFKLSPGYEVYAVGLFDDYEAKGIEHIDLPPLLWRTKTGNSFVFVVGTDIFRGMPLAGILTGFMAHENEVYLYPVVNAQTISLVDFPYLSDENKVTMKDMYSRSSKDLARDILWPNIIQILKNYKGSYNFFAASQLDYPDDVGPDGNNLEFYLREIKSLPGDLGLSLSQVSETGFHEVIDKNYLFYRENLPDKHFDSLYLGEFDEKEFIKESDHELLKGISLVMSDYNEGDRLLDLVDGDVLSVKFNLYGYRHETMDDIRMICAENALAMCNMKVDISRVIFPEDSFDEWHNLSLIWSKGDTYFKEFDAFDMVSVSELEKRARRFLALDFTYEYDKNGIDISIGNFDEEAYFILSASDKSIESIDNGKYEKIRDGKYLIKAFDAHVHIGLREENILEKPKNNRMIHHDPYAREERP